MFICSKIGAKSFEDGSQTFVSIKKVIQDQLLAFRTLIDHFTVVCLVTWPVDGSEARVDLVLIQTSLLLLCKTSCSDFNKVHLHDKSREVCIKTRSTLASLPSTGQVAEQTTVKWSIIENAFLNLYVMPCTPWESRKVE